MNFQPNRFAAISAPRFETIFSFFSAEAKKLLIEVLIESDKFPESFALFPRVGFVVFRFMNLMEICRIFLLFRKRKADFQWLIKQSWMGLDELRSLVMLEVKIKNQKLVLTSKKLFFSWIKVGRWKFSLFSRIFFKFSTLTFIATEAAFSIGIASVPVLVVSKGFEGIGIDSEKTKDTKRSTEAHRVHVLFWTHSWAVGVFLRSLKSFPKTHVGGRQSQRRKKEEKV